MDDKKYQEAIAEVMKDKTQREALAEILIEYIQPNHIAVDYIGMLLNARVLNLGDSIAKKIRKGIKVHTWVPGSIGLKSEITVKDRINYILDAAEVGVMANEWELQSGEIGTVESIRNEALAKLRDYYLNKVFTALSTIWSAANTPNNYATMATAVTQPALEAMIEVVNRTTGRAKAIVGVRNALLPITKFAAFFGTTGGTATPATGSQERINEWLSTGWIGNYMGVPLIPLTQEYDNPEDNNALLPEDKILVIGENVGDFITYGPEKTKEWTDMQPTPPYWHMDIVQQFGMIIDKADGIGVLHIS